MEKRRTTGQPPPDKRTPDSARIVHALSHLIPSLVPTESGVSAPSVSYHQYSAPTGGRRLSISRVYVQQRERLRRQFLSTLDRYFNCCTWQKKTSDQQVQHMLSRGRQRGACLKRPAWPLQTPPLRMCSRALGRTREWVDGGQTACCKSAKQFTLRSAGHSQAQRCCNTCAHATQMRQQRQC